MTNVMVQAGGAVVRGVCKRLVVKESYPSSSGPSTVCLYIVVNDPDRVCELQEAIGDICTVNEDHVRRLSPVDGGMDGGLRVLDGAAVVDAIRAWLATPNRIMDIPTDWIRQLLRAYEVQRAKVDIANQEIERLKGQVGKGDCCEK